MIIGKYLAKFNSTHAVLGWWSNETSLCKREIVNKLNFSPNKSANTNLIVQLGKWNVSIIENGIAISCTFQIQMISSKIKPQLSISFNAPHCHIDLNSTRFTLCNSTNSKLIHFNPTLLNISLNKIQLKLLIKIISFVLIFSF